jgi:aspartate/methionine/tyrosine aminotransferase
MIPPAGFVPPPYPHDRLDDLKEVARAVPGGLVDCSVGTPVDPMPEVAVRALADAASGATGYPATIGSAPYREAAAAWIARRFGCVVSADEVVACIGTKELVASLPRALSLRDPSRDVVLYPAAAYPTYEMGATLAGLRAVPVPLDENWRLDLSRVVEADAERALVLWLNDPSNPTGVTATPREMAP